MSAIVNALSVDVEEYYHALVFREGTGAAAGARLESRVEASVEQVLGLMARHGVRATFFVLGEVAQAHPGLVRRIAGEGHEIGSHGDRHELVSRQTREEFRSDVCRAKSVLEDITGAAVLGYRAPNFSIGASQAWAYDILLEAGLRYDSSSYPIAHDRYGDRKGRRFPFVVRRDGRQTLVEFPVGTLRVGRVNFPIGGGGYFRLLPVAWFRRGIQRVNAREGQPTMFYFHPWELDPGQPRPVMPWRYRARHYLGLEREAAKLDHLLGSVPFGPAADVLGVRIPS